MLSSSANNGKQCAANAGPQVSQKTQNLDKNPLIPPKDTPKKKKDTSTVINECQTMQDICDFSLSDHHTLPGHHIGGMGQLQTGEITEHNCWI
eukprot:15356192-Ditylum_brightwellii.AAC.1